MLQLFFFFSCSNQYEFTHTSKNSTITSVRKTFADTAEDELQIKYFG